MRIRSSGDGDSGRPSVYKKLPPIIAQDISDAVEKCDFRKYRVFLASSPVVSGFLAPKSMRHSFNTKQRWNILLCGMQH